MKKTLTLISSIFIFIGCVTSNIPKKTVRAPSFSFEELLSAEKVALPPLQYKEAGDKSRLAFREYVPQKMEAILLFYHGGGTYSSGGYEFIGDGLSKQYNILVVTPDIRGHGDSSGERGDTPSVAQVFDDIGLFIRYLRAQYPGKSVFLGGHSSGGGLILNYSSFKNREKGEGYLFLSPHLGFRSKNEIEDIPYPFATAKTSLFVKNAMFGTHGHSPAVFFNYSKEILQSSKNIAAITVFMANAQTPVAPDEQLQELILPVAIWIGENDEVLDAAKVTAFFKENSSKSSRKIIEKERHLSILLTASNYLGPWLQKMVQEK